MESYTRLSLKRRKQADLIDYVARNISGLRNMSDHDIWVRNRISRGDIWDALGVTLESFIQVMDREKGGSLRLRETYQDDKLPISTSLNIAYHRRSIKEMEWKELESYIIRMKIFDGNRETIDEVANKYIDMQYGC